MYAHGRILGTEAVGMSPTKKIICVDDDISILQIVKECLCEHFLVAIAGSALKWLDLMETDGPFDIVISDHEMPGMKGLEFLSLVAERWPETIRILMSGCCKDMDSVTRAINAGQISRFIPKPFNPVILADQLLDRQKNPSWHGERTKLLYSFPTADKLWAEYARIRDESLRADGDGHEATEFYLAHREEMDAGAVAAWPPRYLASRGEISAIQHAMNLKFDNERAFFAEYQNEPLKPSELRRDLLTVQMVCEKANGRACREVPLACTKLTMFVDVHNKLLYYCVCGWQDDFTGFVVDYGTYPEQGERIFALDGSRKTLGRAFPGAGLDGAIQAGLEKLVSTYLSTDFRRGAGLMRIDRLLVDMGYKPGIVAAVKHKAGGTAMMLAKGMGIKAGSKPMSSFSRRSNSRSAGTKRLTILSRSSFRL